MIPDTDHVLVHDTDVARFITLTHRMPRAVSERMI